MTPDASTTSSMHHWESRWEQTSRFGARRRLEIDINSENNLTAKLVNQSALSRVFEKVSNFLPEGSLRQWTRQFTIKESKNITDEVIDRELSGKIGNVITDVIALLQEHSQNDWSHWSITQISTDVHDSLIQLFKNQKPGNTPRSLSQSVLDISSVSGSVINPSVTREEEIKPRLQGAKSEEEEVDAESEEEGESALNEHASPPVNDQKDDLPLEKTSDPVTVTIPLAKSSPKLPRFNVPSESEETSLFETEDESSEDDALINDASKDIDRPPVAEAIKDLVSPDAVEDNMGEEEPPGIDEPFEITYEQINDEASPNSLTNMILNKLRLRAVQLKEAIGIYDRRLEFLMEKYPSITFVKIREQLNKIVSDFEKKITTHDVRWLGMKYPTPVADLKMEQLIEFEAAAKQEVKHLLQVLSQDRLGINRFADAVNAHVKLITEAETYLAELRSPQIAQRAVDDKTKNLIDELVDGLQKSIQKEKIALATLLAQADGSNTLVSLTDHANGMRHDFEQALANRKRTLANELFLQDVRTHKENPIVLAAVKKVPVDNIIKLIDAYHAEIADAVKDIDGNKMLSHEFKKRLNELIEQNRLALDPLRMPDFSFSEGKFSLGWRTTKKALTEATGAQLLQYRQEAIAALESARARISPFLEGLSKAKEGQKTFEEYLQAAKEKLASRSSDRSFIIAELQRAVDENAFLANEEQVFDQPEQLLEHTKKLGHAAAALKASLDRVTEFEGLSPAERLNKGSKFMISRDPELVKASAEASVHVTIAKIIAYEKILQDPILVRHLPKDVIAELKAKIKESKNSAPIAPKDISPKSVAEFKRAADLWALTAIRNLENHYHLCAFKNACEAFEEETTAPRTWSGKQTLTPLAARFNQQVLIAEKALREISGGNSIAQAVKTLTDCVSQMQKTRQLLEFSWTELRDEVKQVITSLEAKKKAVEEMTEPKLTSQFKKVILKPINDKIKSATPYLLGLPSKSWISWATPFDKMDENTLKIYQAEVDQLTSTATEAIDRLILGDKVSNAKQIYLETVKAVKLRVDFLEKREHYILASDLQNALNKQSQNYDTLISGEMDSTQDLEDFCTSVGGCIATLNNVIGKIRQHVHLSPPARLVQMEIIEMKWKDSFTTLPPYDRLREALLTDAAIVLDRCLAFTREKADSLPEPQRNGWQTSYGEIKLLKEKFLPGGIKNQLKNLFISQAVPVEKLNAEQMKQYLEQVKLTRKRFFGE